MEWCENDNGIEWCENDNKIEESRLIEGNRLINFLNVERYYEIKY